MIYICNTCSSFSYEIEDVVKLFFRQDEIFKLDEPLDNVSGALLLCREIQCQGETNIEITLKAINYYKQIVINAYLGNEEIHCAKRRVRRGLKRKLYLLLSEYTGKQLPWGVLTGIRPTKIVNEMLDHGKKRQEIIEELQKDYFVSDNKASLLYEVAVNQRKMFLNSDSNSISLYIGIPFCPTRCLYCSFSSSTLEQYKNKVDAYLDTLLYEMGQTAAMLYSRGLSIESIYIGGGTPTSLNANQLTRLLYGIEQHFDMEKIKEYTLEAGRPDTISLEKLNIIKNSRVNRISINPQTMNAETLDKIGRRHTPEDIKRVFALARQVGFDNINMDIICGLPGETISMFENTLKEISLLGPDSLTVHTMSIKRAARITEEKKLDLLQEQYSQVSQMVDMARQSAADMGLVPYYLQAEEYSWKSGEHRLL